MREQCWSHLSSHKARKKPVSSEGAMWRGATGEEAVGSVKEAVSMSAQVPQKGKYNHTALLIILRRHDLVILKVYLWYDMETEVIVSKKKKLNSTLITFFSSNSHH